MNGDSATASSIGAGATFLPVARTRVLHAPGDAQPAGVIELAHVAGAEPTLGVEHARSVGGPIQITEHQLRAAGLDLAAGRIEPQLGARHRLATVPYRYDAGSLAVRIGAVSVNP